jgi:ComF family protein
LTQYIILRVALSENILSKTGALAARARDTLLDLLFPPRPRDVALLAMDAGAFSALARRATVPYADERRGITALFAYRDPLVRRLVWLAKYRGHPAAIALCADLLLDAIRSDIAERAPFAGSGGKPMLIAVPMRRSRVRERGFNQSDLLCRALAARDKNVFFEYTPNVLYKIKDTDRQTSIKDKTGRRKNVKDAFSVTDAARVRGRAVLLIDDVYTTGATVGEAMRALKRAGAREALAYALAH